MASPTNNAASEPSASAGGSAPAASQRGVIVPYPETAIARRFFPPIPQPTHPLMVKARAVAASALPTLVMIVGLLLLWQMLCGSPESNFPSPVKVWQESHDVIVHPFKGVEVNASGLHIQESGDVGIAGHVLTSLGRVLIGYGIAAVVGIALGILIGQSVFAFRALDPLFQVLRTIPPLAWLPLSLAAFRDGQPSAIFVIFITSVWPIIINTAVGIRNIPQDYRNVAAVVQLNPLEFFSKIMIPAAAPYIFTGLRIGIGLSWLAIVAAEMLIGGVGIGFFIWDAWNSSHISEIILALFYVGIIGFVLDRLIAGLAKFVTRGTALS